MANVSFPKKLSARFYRRAKKVFPNEEYAILLGHKTGKDLEIVDLYFPMEDTDRSPDFVPVQLDWFEDALDEANFRGLSILGDIHSHCYDVDEEGMPGTDPSEQDWDYADYMKKVSGGKYCIMGIVRVTNKSGRKSCRTRFWPAVILPVRTT